MKVVIQCAASKHAEAGCFRTAGPAPTTVKFVADPSELPSVESCRYARPDDVADAQGRSWRDLLTAYNQRLTNENPYRLSHAYRLYKDRAYVDLVERLGTRSVYVLSAGWGLIRSDFLTPQYDITFSRSAQRYKRRRQRDVYLDFCQLQDVGDGPVLFFGGKDYLPLFAKLTADLRAERVVFFNSNTHPQVPGCTLKRYETTAKTNWHYGCVCALLDGRLPYSPDSLR